MPDPNELFIEDRRFFLVNEVAVPHTQWLMRSATRSIT